MSAPTAILDTSGAGSNQPRPWPAAPLPDGYEVRSGPPALDDYMRLRQTPPLTPKSPAQAAAGLHGAWFAAHIVHTTSGTTVAMGRVLGDGGWYFHIIDCAVATDHQRRGLGAAILARLLQEIRDRAPPGAFVNLLADPAGRKLYERFGFKYTAPHSLGMGQNL